VAIRRRRTAANPGLDELVSETSDLVAQLLRENRMLKAENERLSRELQRLSRGWDEIRRLARAAPRSTPRRRSGR
jgi:cell division protein FtsB